MRALYGVQRAIFPQQSALCISAEKNAGIYRPCAAGYSLAEFAIGVLSVVAVQGMGAQTLNLLESRGRRREERG